MEQVDVNIANSILEEQIVTILDNKAPMKNIQQWTRYCRWLKGTTKDCMVERNNLRDIARRTQLEDDGEIQESQKRVY